MLALASGHKEIRIYDLPAGDLRMSFPIPDSARFRLESDKEDYWNYTVSFSADRGTLILGTAGGEIHRWDTSTRSRIAGAQKGYNFTFLFQSGDGCGNHARQPHAGFHRNGRSDSEYGT